MSHYHASMKMQRPGMKRQVPLNAARKPAKFSQNGDPLYGIYIWAGEEQVEKYDRIRRRYSQHKAVHVLARLIEIGEWYEEHFGPIFQPLPPHGPPVERFTAEEL